MKKLIQNFRYATACILVATTATLASAFEGKIEMKNTVGKEVIPMTWLVKGSLIRMETKAQGGKRKGGEESFVAIMDTTAFEMTVLMEKEKMYMVQKLPREEMEKAQKDADMEFKPTGRKEKIAGIEAEEYVGVSKKQRVETWVTKELGKFIMANPGGPMGGGRKKKDAWQAFAEKENLFPLRTITRANKEGAPEDSRLEVVSVEKSALPDSLFKPPADFQKFEVPGIGDMMKGMIPGR